MPPRQGCSPELPKYFLYLTPLKAHHLILPVPFSRPVVTQQAGSFSREEALFCSSFSAPAFYPPNLNPSLPAWKLPSTPRKRPKLLTWQACPFWATLVWLESLAPCPLCTDHPHPGLNSRDCPARASHGTPWGYPSSSSGPGHVYCRKLLMLNSFF